MSLALLGRNASYELRWRQWALLRDTLVGLFGPSFPIIASFGDVLTQGPSRLNAAALAEETVHAHGRLTDYPIDRLLLGVQTAAVLYPQLQLDRVRPLNDVEKAQIAPTAGATTLADYFATMCHSIAHVCTHPFVDGTVVLVDN